MSRTLNEIKQFFLNIFTDYNCTPFFALIMKRLVSVEFGLEFVINH